MGQAGSVLENAADSNSSVMSSELISKKLAHGCDLFINDDGARKIFSSYITSGNWIEKFKAFDFNNDNPNPNADKETASPVAPQSAYILPKGKEDYVKSRIGNAAEPKAVVPEISNSARASSIIATCFSSEQMKSILLATLFPIFLESKEYATWVESSIPLDVKSGNSGKSAPGGVPTMPSTPDPTSPEDTGNALAEREERLDELFQPSSQRVNDIISEAATSIDVSEMDKMLSNGNWLSNLLATVEDLPLCVSLATARSDRRGFPLVYVNKKFSSVTGYQREEIVGQNCKFLQSDKSEPEQVAKLVEALARAHPCKVALTNKRKDGSEFFNLLAMKPIFDASGEYAYVIGVQYDISDEMASAKEIKMVDDLLSILPNIFR